MLRGICLTLAAASALFLPLVSPSQFNSAITTTGSRIAPSDGKAMFARYCTPCHGQDGRGLGRIVVAEHAEPVDLTALTRNNDGKFPETHVVNVLQYGARILSHTSVEMPVWGPILGKLNKHDPHDRLVRVLALTHYLETIQEK